MVVLSLLYFFYLHNVWAEDVSNSLSESASSSRGHLHHEAPEDSANDFNWRIWGGATVDITQAPYAILYGVTCTGVLIAPNWAMTAAHCIVQHVIFAGSAYRQNAQPFPISRQVYHPGWFPPKIQFTDYDFLLLELAVFVPITDFTRPIAIADYVNAGEPVVVSGWGHAGSVVTITPLNSKNSDVLKQLWMTAVEWNDCVDRVLPFYQSIYGETLRMTPRMSCAQSSGGGTCYGDSGGPVVAHGQLVGLVSWGTHCEPFLVFSNVIVVRDWIRAVTGLNL